VQARLVDIDQAIELVHLERDPGLLRQISEVADHLIGDRPGLEKEERLRRLHLLERGHRQRGRLADLEDRSGRRRGTAVLAGLLLRPTSDRHREGHQQPSASHRATLPHRDMLGS
jgi:hypothetical protein